MTSPVERANKRSNRHSLPSRHSIPSPPQSRQHNVLSCQQVQHMLEAQNPILHPHRTPTAQEPALPCASIRTAGITGLYLHSRPRHAPGNGGGGGAGGGGRGPALPAAAAPAAGVPAMQPANTACPQPLDTYVAQARKCFLLLLVCVCAAIQTHTT
jgi:hypothetical protein